MNYNKQGVKVNYNCRKKFGKGDILSVSPFACICVCKAWDVGFTKFATEVNFNIVHVKLGFNVFNTYIYNENCYFNINRTEAKDLKM